MTDNNDKGRRKSRTTSDIRELAGGLEELTSEEGPLYLLVCEIRKSNSLALRNVVLQFISLVLLALCIIGIVLIGFLFHRGTVALTQSEQHLQYRTKHMQSTGESVAHVLEQQEEAPKIVSDDQGQLRVVATVKLNEDFAEPAAEENTSTALVSLSAYKLMKEKNASTPQVKKRAARKQIEIPLDMADAHEIHK
jgi:hypothetical protein